MPHPSPSAVLDNPIRYNSLWERPSWQRNCIHVTGRTSTMIHGPPKWEGATKQGSQAAGVASLGSRLVDGQAELGVAWHLESVGVSGESASVAPSAGGFVRRDQAGLARFRGVDHDFGRPVVAARTMTGLTLDSRRSGRSGRVASQTGGRVDLDVQALGGTAVSGRLPASVDGTMTKLAAVRADEGHLVDAQTEKTTEEDEPTGAEIIGLHPFLSIRLARANRARQGMGPRCGIVGRGEHDA